MATIDSRIEHSPDAALEIRCGFTSEFEPAVIGEVRRLLERAFDGEFSDDDWDHSVGGLHAIAWERGAMIGHACVVQRRIVHRGVALRAGYVEAVAVDPRARRRGIGHRLMAPIEQAIARAFDFGALAASDDGVALYRSRGWLLWRGRLSALTPDGIVATPEDEGGIYVLPGARALDLDGELTCDFRGGDLW